MTLRENYPQPKLPRSHYFFSLARGENIRTFALRPLALWGMVALVPLLTIWGAAAGVYIAFHDDMLSAIVARQAELQYAYEDRLADARAELDRVASRQLLDQNSFEGKVHELLSRQAQLEQRSSIVAALAKQVVNRDIASSGAEKTRASIGAAKGAPASQTALDAINRAAPSDSIEEAPARAYAPTAGIIEAPRAAKPRPLEEPHDYVSALSPSDEDVRTLETAAAENSALDAHTRLRLIGFSLDRMERRQMSTLARIGDLAARVKNQIGAAVAQAGLDANALVTPHNAAAGVGGPFIPLSVDPKAPAFDKTVAQVAREVQAAEKLETVLPYVPLNRPLVGEANVSSPFGYRPDPFLGRPALHPGLDLIQPYGSEIHCTGAGRVIHAGPMGGYGQMVEIDHGNGLTTRYGHMSEILVQEGQDVKQGEAIGRLGSTGRSTGPHLHYEVRVDGEPVDPERFLHAGATLAAQ